MNEMFWKHEYLTLKEVEIPKLIGKFLEDLDILWGLVCLDSDTGKDSDYHDKMVEKWEKRL